MKLVDFLIEVSDPQNFAEFQKDPELAIETANLSLGDRLAVLSRDTGVIRYQATHNDYDFKAKADHAGEVAVDFVHVEINHQTETEHESIAEESAFTIKRRFGPYMTFYPENAYAK
jgi:hypothetical protein